MRISNIVKGQITQSLAKVLFERAGYRVVRFGIEELFQEVVHLDAKQYSRLGLPPSLKLLPDLLVADTKIDRAFLVEVKFRSSITAESLAALYEKLAAQQNYWPEMYTVLMTSTARRNDSTFHQDFIRVLRPGDLGMLIPNSFVLSRSRPENLGSNVWKKLPMLHEAFDRFDWKNDFSTVEDADFVATTLRDLNALSE